MIGFLLLIPSLVLNFFLWQRTEQGLKNDEGILVIAVLDGDTLVLDGKARLKLRQVDAPNTSLPLWKKILASNGFALKKKRKKPGIPKQRPAMKNLSNFYC